MQPVKMIVTARYIGEEGSKRPGDIILVTERRAAQLEASSAAKREGLELKKPSLPDSGPAQPPASSQAAPALPPQIASTQPAEDGASSVSTTPIASPPASTSSTPVMVDGGTPTKRGRGRPPKARG